MHVKYMVEYELGAKSEEFALWAFGEKYQSLKRKEMMNAWNEKHSDKLKLDVDGRIEGDLKKMIKIYKEHCDH